MKRSTVRSLFAVSVFSALALLAASPLVAEDAAAEEDSVEEVAAAEGAEVTEAPAAAFDLSGAVDTRVSYAKENGDSIYSGLSEFHDMRAESLVDGKLTFSRDYTSVGLLDFTFGDDALLDHADGSTVESLYFEVNELYGDLNFGDLFFLRLGKQRLSWGAGYVFNPSDPVNPPKNPTDRRAVREGVPALKAELIAKPVSFMAFAVPADSADENGYGAKLSTSALSESDVAVSYYWSRSQSWTGALNVSSAPLYALPGWDTIQVWLECSVSDRGRYGAYGAGPIPGSAVVVEEDDTQYCALLGTSAQLPVMRTVLLAEYYHLSEGLSGDELADIYGALGSSDAAVVGASADWYSELARRPGRQASDYLFLSVNQPTVTDSGDPVWDKIGISATCLLNLVDRSFYAGTDLALTFVKNSQLDFTAAWAVGEEGTEFGDAPERLILGLELKVYF